jgi:[protein-PII] uridylyltransferase
MTDALALTAATTFRPAVTQAAAALAELRRRIAAQHAADAPGIQTCGLASDLCDAVVIGLWNALLDDLPAAAAAMLRRHAALVAHGGYGRREMAPFSDIDLMLLYDRGAAGPVADAAKRLLQDLFDAGADVGQSVRTVDEACRLAAADPTILSSLLECRPLAGNQDLLARLETRLRGLVQRGQSRLARALVDARREEAIKYGETVALLEPNVKRSPGGLRDIQLVRWLGRVLYGESKFDTLALAGGLSRADADTLRDAAEFLTRLRNEMHLAAGKAADDLTRDQQLRIAEARGIESRDGLLGVERFMRDYFRHTRGVAQVAETLIAGLRRPHPARVFVAGVLGNRVDGLFRVGPHDIAAAAGCLPQVVGSLGSIVRLSRACLRRPTSIPGSGSSGFSRGRGGWGMPCGGCTRWGRWRFSSRSSPTPGTCCNSTTITSTPLTSIASWPSNGRPNWRMTPAGWGLSGDSSTASGLCSWRC